MMRHAFARLLLGFTLLLSCLTATGQEARPGDVQLAGQPAAAPRQDASMAPLQNVYGRSHLSLNGRWSYIVDPFFQTYVKLLEPT